MMNNGQVSSIGLLVSGSGTGSSILLGLTASGISHQERSVILQKQFLDLSLLSLVDVFLVVGNNTLREGLSDGIDLRDVATTPHTDADVQILESLESEEEDGFEDLGAK